MRITSAIPAALVAIGLTVVSAPAAMAQPAQPRVAAPGQPSIGDIVFSEIEKRLIRDYYGRHPVGSVKPLPPGIQRKIARGGTLPPGIAKRYLPGELEGQLPVRAGFERRIVGRDVLLVEQATGLILDILEGALRRR